ncbi:hypothetical protein GCM10029992_37710 [Glycomyces albus]
MSKAGQPPPRSRRLWSLVGSAALGAGAPPALSVVSIFDTADFPTAMPTGAALGVAICIVNRARRRFGSIRPRLTPRMVARVIEAFHVLRKGERTKTWWDRLNSADSWRELLEQPPPVPADRHPGERGSDATAVVGEDVLGLQPSLREPFDKYVVELQEEIREPDEYRWQALQPVHVARVGDAGVNEWTRLVLAQMLARRDKDLGARLLYDLAFEAAISVELRLQAADDLFQWDPAGSQVCYEYFTNCNEMDIEYQILACERLGRCDKERAISALSEKAANKSVAAHLRFLAAEKIGRFSEAKRILAFKLLACDYSMELEQRIAASGRLRELGDPAAERALRHGAENERNPDEVRQLCRTYLNPRH